LLNEKNLGYTTPSGRRFKVENGGREIKQEPVDNQITLLIKYK